jgi:serine/threonine-protein kinase
VSQHLSSIGSVREDLSRIVDADLQASLGHVAAARRDEDPFRTVSHASLGAPSALGARFRVLRPHAKGGLGEVFVALDTELNRDVALKEIQDRYADDPRFRSRFEYEAEVTGGLEHPGIVPVYGLGHTPDGRPFYAMRFIRGDSLKEAIRRFHEAEDQPGRDPGHSALGLRELLGRFLDVSDAVAYAHNRGVLHRDLKPGNILLGRYGETLVVDWGLAKALDGPPEESSAMPEAEPRLRPASGSALEPTQAGSAVGTPGYMSPEQVDNQFGPLGIRSDVYCLGATLYHLLTGHAPCEADHVGAIYQKVLAGEIPRPRSLNPRLAPALEAICLKALAVQPSDRYPTAEALKADVERWLADEPVTAWRERWVERSRRWARRHRTLVISSAAVLFIALVGLGAFSLVLSSKNRQLDAKNLELAGTNQELDQQRQRAEQREALAIDAVKKFRDAVQTNVELKNRPELEGLRKALLKEPLEFFRRLRDQLQADHDTRPDSLAKLAGSSFDLAETTRQIGSVADALRSYSEAVAIRERLAHDHPDVVAYRTDLAIAHNNLGNVLDETGRPAEALESYRASHAIWERLARDDPASPAYQGRLATCHNNLGALLYSTGRPAQALQSYGRALAIRQRLAHEHPGDTRYQADLATTHNNLGKMLSETGRSAEAMESSRKLIAIGERLAREHPDAAEFRQLWAVGLDNLGILLIAGGRGEEAMGSYRSALAIRERLAREHPSMTEYQYSLAASHNSIGKLLIDTGRPVEALESYHRALAILERLARDNPAVVRFQNGLAFDHTNIGALLAIAGRPAEALESYRRALAIRERLAREHPTIVEHQSHLARGHLNIGAVLGSMGRDGEALESYRRALAIQERLAREHPSNPEYQGDLGASFHNIAQIQIDRGRWAEAGQQLDRAIDHQRKALAAAPRHPIYRQTLGKHLMSRVKVDRALGQTTRAIRTARELAALSSGDPDVLYDAACALAMGLPPAPAGDRAALDAEAMQRLREAVAAGWSDAGHTGRDPDLDLLRNRDDFRRLLAHLFDRGFPADPFAP